MVEHTHIEFPTAGNTDLIDITSAVETIIDRSEMNSGLINLFVPGSTGALTTIEFEDALVRDLKECVDEIAPKNRNWAHNATWGDGNGHSHLRASIFGPSLSIPVVNNRLIRGTWQQVVFIDFDNRARQRKIVVTLVGEK
jgi:secondary thiamine-phosphate synthase enzyme